jgi:hypothetical protein
VVGLHIILGPSRHIWLERASYPVVSDQLVQKIGTELIRNDKLFNAALVSFGSFGVIHAAMIETEPIYLLEAHRMKAPLDDGLRKAIRSLDFSEISTPDPGVRPYHFDVVINPYDLDSGVFYTMMYKRAYRDDYERIGGGDWGVRPGDDFLHIVGLLTDKVPSVVPSLVNGVINNRYNTFSNRQGTLGEMFSYTAIHGGASTGSTFGAPTSAPAFGAFGASKPPAFGAAQPGEEDLQPGMLSLSLCSLLAAVLSSMATLYSYSKT